MHRRVLTLATVVLSMGSLSAAAASAQIWSQWGGNPQHTGAVAVAGQPARHMLQDIVYDPFTAQEQTDPLSAPDLSVHFQSPLIDGDNVFMEFKSGTYTTLDHWETQTWNEKRLHWEHGSLEVEWSFASDWKPAPYSTQATGPAWEPVFHAVLTGNYIYVPGAGGSIYKLNKTDGSLVAHFSPLGSDRDTFLSGPPAVDAAGNVYYHASKFVHGAAWSADVVGSWLVKVSTNGSTHVATYASLNPGAPAGNAKCLWVFDNNQLPWPPSPSAVPPSVTCGSLRPGLNSGIGIAPDGTLYTVASSHFVERNGYLIAVNPDLTPKWVASLKERFHDGCNVIIPPTGTLGGCRAGAHDGVDPSQNRAGSGRVTDDSTATPAVAPDGTVYYGAYSRYNYFQGHLMKFSAQGNFLGAWPFGWDMTPTIWSHDGTYSLAFKENHYGDSGSYCDVEEFCPADRTANNPAYPEAYYITQLAKNLTPEWQYQNTNTESCTRNADNTVTCVSDHPFGFEWCVNGAVADSNGVIYVNSEDGGLYTINQGGTLRDHLFLKLAIGAAYTPLSMGGDGKIYTQNAGHMYVVGR
jgi:hypothetical protein